MAKNLLQNSCDLVPVTPVAATDQIAAPFGLVKIASQTTGSATSIPFIGLAQYPYLNYKIFFNSITGLSVLSLQVSTNNGSSYISSGYTSGNIAVDYNSAAWGLNSTATSSIILTTTSLTASHWNGEVTIMNVNTSANYFVATCSSTETTGANIFFSLSQGVYGTLTPINAIQVLSGAAFSGTFSLYGYN